MTWGSDRKHQAQSIPEKIWTIYGNPQDLKVYRIFLVTYICSRNKQQAVLIFKGGWPPHHTHADTNL